MHNNVRCRRGYVTHDETAAEISDSQRRTHSHSYTVILYIHTHGASSHKHGVWEIRSFFFLTGNGQPCSVRKLTDLTCDKADILCVQVSYVSALQVEPKCSLVILDEWHEVLFYLFQLFFIDTSFARASGGLNFGTESLFCDVIGRPGGQTMRSLKK